MALPREALRRVRTRCDVRTVKRRERRAPGGMRRERGVYAAEVWETKRAFGLRRRWLVGGRFCGLKAALRARGVARQERGLHAAEA